MVMTAAAATTTTAAAAVAASTVSSRSRHAMHPRQQRQPHCSNPRVRGAWSCLHAASTQTGPALATRCSSCKTLDCLHSLACDVMGKDRVCECECVLFLCGSFIFIAHAVLWSVYSSRVRTNNQQVSRSWRITTQTAQERRAFSGNGKSHSSQRCVCVCVCAMVRAEGKVHRNENER